jgi:hypothetical protein
MTQQPKGPPQPPSERILHEFPPVIQPWLRDMPVYPGPEIEGGFKPVKSTAIEGRDWREVLRQAPEVALGDRRVRERLSAGRYASLGASVLEDIKGEGAALPVHAFFYDYDANVTVQVELAREGRKLVVVGITETDYQPAPSDGELQRAIAIAREDRGLADRLTEDLEPMPILTSAVEQGDRHYRTRRIIVGFGRLDERLPRLQALVDLGSERVLGVGVDLRHGVTESEGFAAKKDTEGGGQ